VVKAPASRLLVLLLLLISQLGLQMRAAGAVGLCRPINGESGHIEFLWACPAPLHVLPPATDQPQGDQLQHAGGCIHDAKRASLTRPDLSLLIEHDAWLPPCSRPDLVNLIASIRSSAWSYAVLIRACSSIWRQPLSIPLRL
jgi:hypothetical protein